MQPQNVRHFKQSFARFLSLPEWQWSWVCHQTFDSRKVGDENGKLYPSLIPWSFHHMMSEIARSAMLNYGFYFAERGALGRLHWHAIVHVKENLLGQPRRSEIWKEQFSKFGRCRFEPYTGLDNPVLGRVSTGIANYLCKYVAKDVFSEDATWDFAGFMGGSTADSKRIGRLIGIEPTDWPEIQEEGGG